MKALTGLAVILFLGVASDTKAEISLNGTDLSVPELMEKCSQAEGGSEAQLKCFDMLAKLLKQQENEETTDGEGDSAVIRSLDALRAVAQYQDAESGLSIVGNGCQIQILYYANYYRISRRNVASIDLFNAWFNASKMRYDKVTQVQGPTMTWFRGLMDEGATAVSHGGAALESSTNNFGSKPARATIAEYANQIVDQLPTKESQEFDFVLIHPKRSQSGNEIWAAFQNFARACQG